MNLEAGAESDGGKGGMKPKVFLYGLRQFALIVPWDSGVVYVNQTGGIICHQHEIEGAVIPLDHDLNAIAVELTNAEGLTAKQADLCDQVFRKIHEDWTTDMEVDRARLAHSQEAWLWVWVRDFGPAAPSGIWAPLQAVLTWDNSD